MAEKSEREIDHTITRNIPRLAKYGVLTVRPGYEITGHQLTGRRAVVTTVHTKKPLAELAPSEKLPDRIGGVPVDVREARPYQPARGRSARRRAEPALQPSRGRRARMAARARGAERQAHQQ